MLTKEKKQELVESLGAHPKDSGGASVQISILTARINGLLGHFATNPKDHTSRRGLLKMVGHRRRLLAYLRRTAPKQYTDVIRKLDIRK